MSERKQSAIKYLETVLSELQKDGTTVHHFLVESENGLRETYHNDYVKSYEHNGYRTYYFSIVVSVGEVSK